MFLLLLNLFFALLHCDNLFLCQPVSPPLIKVSPLDSEIGETVNYSVNVIFMFTESFANFKNTAYFVKINNKENNIS